MYEQSSKPTRGCDDALATAVSNGEVGVTSVVVDTLLRLQLSNSVRSALVSASISGVDALRLLVKNPQHLSSFLLANNYCSVSVRNALSGDVIPDEDILVLFDHCIAYLEESLGSVENHLEEADRYIRFLSLLTDGKFMKWFLSMSSSAGPGQRIARLAAIINRYRRTLVQRQIQRVKSGKSCVGRLLEQNVSPQYNGEVFHHTLAL